MNTIEDMYDKKHKESISQHFIAYSEEYLKELRSDLSKCRAEDFRYNFKKKTSSSPAKMIDRQLDDIAHNFGKYKIKLLEEEIDIIEKLHPDLFENLVYTLATYPFIFNNEKNQDEPTFLLEWYIHYVMMPPVFDALISYEKLERRNINIKNYNRDIKNLWKKTTKLIDISETFASLHPIQTEDKILRTLLTNFYLLHLVDDQEGVKVIVSCLSQEGRERLPKDADNYKQKVAQKAGYSKEEPLPQDGAYMSIEQGGYIFDIFFEDDLPNYKKGKKPDLIRTLNNKVCYFYRR